MPSIPYDLYSFIAAGKPDIHAWPIQPADVVAMNRILGAHLQSQLSTSDDELRSILGVAANGAAIANLTAATTMRLVAQAKKADLVLEFGQPSLAQSLVRDGMLQGNPALGRIVERLDSARRAPPRQTARALAHTALLNANPLRWGGTTTALLNHNALGYAEARSARGWFRPTFAHEVLAGGPVAVPPELATRLKNAAAAMTAAVEEASGIAWAAPLDAHRRELQDFLLLVAGWALGVEQHWKTPSVLWTGTGGNLVTRLARRAVKRNGGHVTGFEHGGGVHIHQDASPNRLNEMVMADEFVVDTEDKAAIYRQTLDNSLSYPDASPIIRPPRQKGYRHFHMVGGPRRATPTRRVMYVTTAFVGEVQYPIQPLFADPVYASWQGRLLDGIAAAGFDVLCKQHPEGLRRGEPLITSRHAAYLRGRFAEVVGQADAFVFDYPATTTLWEAMCLEKPVVFIDFGLASWVPEVFEKFRRRVTVIPGRMDADNLPQVDFAQLADALRAPPGTDDTFVHDYLL